MTTGLLNREAFVAKLRAVGGRAYHDKHPFHVAMNEGRISPEALRGWSILTVGLVGGLCTLFAFHSVEQIPKAILITVDALGLSLLAVSGVEKAIETCKQTVYLEDGFVARWKGMLPTDRLIVQAIAAGELDLHGSRSLARIGKALRLGRSADRSVPQNALKRLRDRQILIHSDTGVYRFEDDTFKDWVLTQHPRE